MIELWPHQREALALATDKNVLLAHEPGCGKTFVAAAVCAQFPGRQNLYLCPATLRWQVQNELKRFNPEWNVQVIARGTDEISEDADVVVASYDMASSKLLWPTLYRRWWAALILDEAHYLKNRIARRTRAVYGSQTRSPGALYKRAKRVVAMTGTPVLNNPSDLWTHYSRLFPETLTNDEGKPLSFAQFVDRFCIVRSSGFGEQIVGGKNLDELRKAIGAHIHRVRREDVIADLPELTIDQISLAAENISMQDVPPQAMAALRELLDGADFAEESLEALSPALSTLRRNIGLAKARAVGDLVEDELEGGTGKVIVFGLHPDALKEIARRLTAYKPALITGMTPAHARQAYIDQFTHDEKCRVFIGQIYAAGTGLNLQVADRVIIAEPAWTPAINAQAIARAHRAGQKNPVRASLISLRGSVDDDVVRALTRKARMAAKIID